MSLTLERTPPAALAPVDEGTRRELLAAGLLLGLGLTGCGEDTDRSAGPDARQHQGVGTFAEPNLEAIAALDPDVIVAWSSGGRLGPEGLAIETLERIAPTVAFGEDTPLDRNMASVAAITGRGDEVARQRSAYERDLAGLRAAVPRASDLEVVVAGFADPDVYVFASDNATPSVAIPLAIGARAAGVAQRTPDSIGLYVTLSPERLAEIDADVILYDDFGESITELELWDRLPAVRAGQAHRLPPSFGASYVNYRRHIALLGAILQDAMALGPRAGGGAR